MIVFPPAKINLGLNVVERRPDGFHEIESILVPIPLYDALEAVIETAPGSAPLSYTRTGLEISGDIESDLCYKAVMLLGEIRSLPNLRLHLHKVIPMGAGLGGGSSDGAHTLLLVNALCECGVSLNELHDLAARLGSDCPFFLTPNSKLVKGRGERLTEIQLDLKGNWLVLVDPGIHVSTAEVYRNTEPTGVQWSEVQRAELKLTHFREQLPNTMEAYVFKAYPKVAELKDRLISAGAVYASMSGSGSSVFGLFEQKPVPMDLPEGYRQWTLQL
ncbi:MAG: 4-(cytidine 5'-diphospho)-2-C-methyl-D-erythritol kinase [Flavobacteriales bacterium]|jgi:4-diphosphocytidyl-2-C-methyl-D-erythritol kinase|nr:4-(cytidine 5'-diphospho)-2-C-methyl-D-erythritol kinase [Flavobacteriales bacterium]MBK6884542.1 4-(cytidine 5'-diphospho)-2-C-methyl-D-erythritol kinase [Flavobacteriales bacterium]MBK7100943.1 4-(cytidine 5'-diphospho)-2-C-methyl-D-erythritol kinase [Flavobacteriales bacterium]MBK7111628.1 4-(cytidine 5'-diphospho)-2-C-methyl-D-erythritol kinase [Flavobacteriales bacterium]MBK7484010.1 4-(cytidine 5'-diphospho)-2-C-methyl-D-erythritol kinase [Flavobacteriales bacterium]